jgi:tRNA 2-thiouridine synthesizing protein A
MTDQPAKILDTTGLLCPEPLMLLHNAVRDIASGEVIHVIATDPSTTRDIPKFCTFLGHRLIAQEQEADKYFYWIEKA